MPEEKRPAAPRLVQNDKGTVPVVLSGLDKSGFSGNGRLLHQIPEREPASEGFLESFQKLEG